MPKITDGDLASARNLSREIENYIQETVEGDGEKHLSLSAIERIRVMIQDDAVSAILRSHTLFPDDEVAFLLEMIWHDDVSDTEWSDVANVIFNEFMGRSAGPLATKVLFP